MCVHMDTKNFSEIQIAFDSWPSTRAQRSRVHMHTVDEDVAAIDEGPMAVW